MRYNNQPSLIKGITYGLALSLGSLALAIAGACVLENLCYTPPSFCHKGIEDQAWDGEQQIHPGRDYPEFPPVLRPDRLEDQAWDE